MKDGEKTYSTSQIAGIVGLHPNTVRKYEESFISIVRTLFVKFAQLVLDHHMSVMAAIRLVNAAF